MARYLTLEDEVRAWLGEKRTSLWGNYMITAEDSMDEAVKWFADELRSFWKHRLTARPVEIHTGDMNRAWDVTDDEG